MTRALSRATRSKKQHAVIYSDPFSNAKGANAGVKGLLHALDAVGDKVHLSSNNMHEGSWVDEYLNSLCIDQLVKLAFLICTTTCQSVSLPRHEHMTGGIEQGCSLD